MPSVSLLAHTATSQELPHPYTPSEEPGTNTEELIEFAGRNCYQAWQRKNPKTATNTGYIRNIIGNGHESVLEHASATFKVTCSRSALAEITRHRHLSFSVLSQRFVDSTDTPKEVPPLFSNLPHDKYKNIRDVVLDVFDTITVSYETLMEELDEIEGLTRKQKREAARCILPEASQTVMVVTGNYRAWRDFLKKRYSGAADAELQQIATEVLAQLRALAPTVFENITWEE